jgi:alpha-ketoglutarate-dependent taurine dioxygenase
VKYPPKTPFSEMNSGRWRSAVEAEFRSGGTLTVTQTPPTEDGAALLFLARMIGEPMRRAVPRGDQNADISDGMVHRIEPAKVPAVSKLGLPVRSMTAADFGCHTDESYLADPAEAVVLHCVRQARVGGDTVLADAHDLVRALKTSDAETLQQEAFPHRSGRAAILSGSNENPAIRYNPYEFSCGVLSPRQRRAIMALEEAIGACAIVVRLGPGDCLVLDNRRILHGRTSFDPSDNRLFLRARLRIS